MQFNQSYSATKAKYLYASIVIPCWLSHRSYVEANTKRSLNRSVVFKLTVEI